MLSKATVLTRFHEIANSPRKQLDGYLAQGKKVIACVPVYTPEEIIHSMGLVPMGAWGGDIEVKEAKQYFPAFICSVMQSVLELGMRGDYEGISALVVPSLCDSLKCLGQNWKFAVPSIPFIPMTYPQNRTNKAGLTFVKAGYERVIADLEKITGAKFSDGALANSNVIYNAHNAAMRELSCVLADHPEITAAQRSDVFKSAWFMLKEEHTALVRELIDALRAEPETGRKKLRIITTGILTDSRGLLAALDENDMQIVGDDMANESRQYRVDVPVGISALDALAEKFCKMDNCSVLYDADKKRVDLIMELVKSRKADGVMVALTKFCDPEEFDYVLIKRACEAANVPHMLIEVDRQMTNYEQAKTIIQSFREMMA
ncbi:MAG: 2-hydroxyacyl-CoA dehydratase family protein [Angelakisella sp.]